MPSLKGRRSRYPTAALCEKPGLSPSQASCVWCPTPSPQALLGPWSFEGVVRAWGVKWTRREGAWFGEFFGESRVHPAPHHAPSSRWGSRRGRPGLVSCLLPFLKTQRKRRAQKEPPVHRFTARAMQLGSSKAPAAAGPPHGVQVTSIASPEYAVAQTPELEQATNVQRVLRYLDPFPVTLEQVRCNDPGRKLLRAADPRAAQVERPSGKRGRIIDLSPSCCRSVCWACAVFATCAGSCAFTARRSGASSDCVVSYH